jgi:hypothetical protein
MTADTLTHRQLWEKLGISERQFYRLKSEGYFESLRAPVPHRYSLAKVDRFLHGQAMLHMRRVS